MNLKSGVYLKSFATLNSKPSIDDRRSFSQSKGQTFFHKWKKKTMWCSSEFLKLYSFGDFKFIPLYF